MRLSLVHVPTWYEVRFRATFTWSPASTDTVIIHCHFATLLVKSINLSVLIQSALPMVTMVTMVSIAHCPWQLHFQFEDTASEYLRQVQF